MLDITSGGSVDHEKPVWMDLYDRNEKVIEGARVLVRSAKSKAFTGFVKTAMVKKGRIYRKLENRIKRDKATEQEVEEYESITEKILFDNIAENVIVDWEGIGAPDPSDPTKIKALSLTDENVRSFLNSQDFKDQVSDFISDPENFGGISEDSKEDAKGN